MESIRARMGWIALGMVVSFNLFCWLPASLPAFLIAAAAGITFLAGARSVVYGFAVLTASLVVGFGTALLFPDGYLIYFGAFGIMMVYIPSAIMGLGIRRSMSVARLQYLAAVPILVLMSLYLADFGSYATRLGVVFNSMGQDLINWYREAAKTFPNSINPEDMNLLKQAIESAAATMHRFFAALVICLSLGVNLIAYGVATLMIRKEGGFCRPLAEFSRWKVGLGFMVILAVALIAWITDYAPVVPYAENLLFLLAVIYMITGLSLIEHFLRQKQVHRGMRVLLYIMLFLSGWFGGLVAAALGLIDSHFDFRRLKAHQLG